MKQTLKISNLSAEPGTKVNGFINVPGTAVRMPIILANGVNEGQTLLVTAGIHGGEYPSIEAGIRFGSQLNPTEMSGQIIVMSPVSLNAFHARQAFLVPEDGKNLNRQFPGKALGTMAERMAYTIMTEVVAHIDAWVDLHGGDIPESLVPFSGYIEAADLAVNDRSRALAAAFGIEYVVKPSYLGGTSIAAAAALNIPALLAEAGQLGILDEPNTEMLLNGCWNVARFMKIVLGSVSPIQLREFASWPWVRAEHTGCWYPAVKIGDMVDVGQVVGRVKDYFGNVIAEYKAPASGLVLLVCMALSVNLGDPLVGIAF